MFRAIFCLCALFTVTGYAALPPFYESGREIKAILENDDVAKALA